MLKFRSKKFLHVLLILLPIILILNIYNSIPSKIILPVDTACTYRLYPFTALTEKNDKKAIAATVQNTPLAQQIQEDVNISSSSTGTYSLSLTLFNKIPIKTIDVSVVPKTYVVPAGEAIGVKLYTDGLLIVGMSDVIDKKGEVHYPAKTAGLKTGDRILSINNVPIHSSEEFTEMVSNTKGELELFIIRDDTKLNTKITPVKSRDDNAMKLGIWVRDSTAGIGTLTFYQDNKFAALGHAITDVDTGEIMSLNKGSILSCKILSAKKGERGVPGELLGSFSNDIIGSININNELGIYGKIDTPPVSDNKVQVAARFQIKEGPAYIMADIDGNGVRNYQIEIQKISKSTEINNKGLIIKVTDETLLSKTGGIVQGMSGAPIIQNDMLIGAVTHVFVNDPTKGYGIFAENMIDMTYQIEK